MKETLALVNAGCPRINLLDAPDLTVDPAQGVGARLDSAFEEVSAGGDGQDFARLRKDLSALNSAYQARLRGQTSQGEGMGERPISHKVEFLRGYAQVGGEFLAGKSYW
jgi:hypothetical protein